MIININNHIDTLLVGTIDFDDQLNENLIGTANFGQHIGKCKIEVYSSEGPIPHFHIKNKDSSFDCCVKIYSNEYFDHGYHTDKLSKYQASKLDSYLRMHDEDIPSDKWTIWNTIVMFWKRSNPDCIFPESKKVSAQPDYTKLH